MVRLAIYEEVAEKYPNLYVRTGRHHWRPRPWPVTAALDPATVELPTVDVPEQRGAATDGYRS